MLKHQNVETANKVAYVLLFTASSAADLRANHGSPVQIWLQGFRNHHRAVLLLIIFHDGDPGSSDRQSRTVQGMNEPDLLTGAWPILYIRPAGLKSIEVAAGGNLAIGILARQPHFDIVAFGCR